RATPPPTKVTTALAPRVRLAAVRAADEPDAVFVCERMREPAVCTVLPVLTVMAPTVSEEAAPDLPRNDSSPALSAIVASSPMRLGRLAPNWLSRTSAEPALTVKFVFRAVPWSRRISAPEAALTVVAPL